MNPATNDRTFGLSGKISRSLALLVLLLCVLPAAEAEDWQPPVPMPDEFDWIQLTSGEWLKGEIKVLYEGTMEFDSDKLDLLELDLDDIKVIRSAQTVSVKFTDGRNAVGKLLLEDESVKVLEQGVAEFQRGELVSVTAGVPRERNYWSGKASLGANLREGNTEQTEATGLLNFKRRTVDDRVVIDYIGNYTVTNDVQSANNHRASAVWDHFVSDRFFLRPASIEYFRDPYQNIAHRVTPGAGVGYQLIDSSKTEWIVFAGPAYQWTWFDEVEPGEKDTEETWALSAGTSFDHELTGDIDLRYDYRFQFTSEDAGRYNHHMIAGLSFDLTDALSMDVSLVWDRTEKPRPDADGNVPEKDDYRLVVGVGYDF